MRDKNIDLVLGFAVLVVVFYVYLCQTTVPPFKSWVLNVLIAFGLVYLLRAFISNQ